MTLNLNSGKYWPFCKPNNTPLYIHKDSNHPPNIIKQLPSMIEDRISSLSCDVNEFNKAKSEYNKALRQSGFDWDIKFAKKPATEPRRQRNIIWFNPPFNAQVKTNVGKSFLTLLGKHFPVNHKYHKLFNRNTVKLSYSCTPNVESLISKHNKKVLSSSSGSSSARDPTERTCNCRVPDECPLSGHCLESAIIYKATVSSSDQEEKFYIGATELTFKKRFNNHKQSLEKRAKSNETSLSKYVWELKDKNINHAVKWEIVKRSVPYRCGTRFCELCLCEKYCILISDPVLCLNKNSELLQKCRHKNKFKLSKIPSTTGDVGVT